MWQPLVDTGKLAPYDFLIADQVDHLGHVRQRGGTQ